jgi:hypothetical protein
LAGEGRKLSGRHPDSDVCVRTTSLSYLWKLFTNSELTFNMYQKVGPFLHDSRKFVELVWCGVARGDKFYPALGITIRLRRVCFWYENGMHELVVNSFVVWRWGPQTYQ